MRSIDNLREWWRDRFPVMDRQLGCDFREHIDAIEFEVKALTDERDLLKTQWEAGVDFDQRLEACADKREDVTLFGVDYTPLPVDADGEAIHVGDVMEWDNGTFTVHELKVTEDGWTTWDEQHGYTVHVDVCHHHAPTVEDVLREFADEVQRCCDTSDTIAEYAARLRLAEGVDA